MLVYCEPRFEEPEWFKEALLGVDEDVESLLEDRKLYCEDKRATVSSWCCLNRVANAWKVEP